MKGTLGVQNYKVHIPCEFARDSCGLFYMVYSILKLKCYLFNLHMPCPGRDC